MPRTVELEGNPLLCRRPQSETHAVGAQLGAEGHGVGALHAGPAGRVSSTSERARNV